MKKGKTLIITIIDRSGSMESIADDAIGGFNSFLKQQKAAPGEALFTCVLFNDGYDVICDMENIHVVKELNKKTYIPDGTTALLDAIGRTLKKVGKKLADMPEDERPSNVICAILTDGAENSSGIYTRQQIFDMISHQKNVYKWEFIYLGANQDTFAEAGSIGIDRDSAYSFPASKEGIEGVYCLMSETVSFSRKKQNIPDDLKF